jgi:N12 class adenine-specific DNA methylase
MFHLKKSCDVSNKSKNWYERKKAMVFLHAMGSGKTVTAGVGCLALIRHTMPDCGEFKVLIIVPLTVLHAWYDTLTLWLKRVRVGIFQKQEELTMEAIENTDIIIITHDLVYLAANEFMWKDEEAKECGTKADGSARYTHEFKRGHHPKSKRGIAWQEKHGNQHPPMHALASPPSSPTNRSST